MSNFDTFPPIVQGYPGTAPRIYSATTDDTLGTVTTSGYVADRVSNGELKPFDLIFLNYNVAASQAQNLFSVTSTGGGTLVAWSLPAGVLLAANNLSDLVSPFAAVGNLGIGAYSSFDVTVGQAALATGGSVTLVASSGSMQFKLRTLELEKGGTNFSGGSGDRLGQVTDGTTVYSVIPAAVMQALVNARWGVSTPLPNAASVANNTATVAGAPLVFKYSGGTTDYTAGSLVISGIVERIA